LISSLKLSSIRELEKNGKIVLDEREIDLEDLSIVHNEKPGIIASSEGDITVSLDTTIDTRLLNEGHAREFVNRIQNKRKDSGLNISDRINIFYYANEELKNAIVDMNEYIKNETLASSVTYEESLKDSEDIKLEINELNCYLRIEKV